MAKEEINVNEQILLLSQCFQKLSATEVSIWGKVLKCLGNEKERFNIYIQYLFNWVKNNVAKGELAQFFFGLNVFIGLLLQMSQSELKTFWRKQKLHIKSNYSFCYNVSKSRLLQSCKKANKFRHNCWCFPDYI